MCELLRFTCYVDLLAAPLFNEFYVIKRRNFEYFHQFLLISDI